MDQTIKRRWLLSAATAITGGAVLGSVGGSNQAAVALGDGSVVDPSGGIIRTPPERFATLPDYPFETHFASVKLGGASGARVRMHYLDERPADPAKASGETILLLHGNPSWSYLYRHVVPLLVEAGHRCVAVDLVGFGKSDKLTDRFAYTSQRHVDWLAEAVFEYLDLRDVTMVCHDWGGMLGLRLLAREPSRFRRIVASNFGLAEGGRDLGPGWAYLAQWQQLTQRTEQLRASQVIENFTTSGLRPAVRRGYDAPFPDDPSLHGFRRFAVLIPITADDEANPAIRQTWDVLETLRTPFLCVFSDQDHVFHGDHSGLSARIPGAQGQPHVVIKDAAHFVQEDQPSEFAAAVNDFIERTR
ncbi:haloalkane dehalogenase [Kribbella pratensis]|uniref:Haloalkane dehalogenase n=1 Tax=Kribbella pratensis TaxID=2512112 RepID=A0A4R8CPD1_9ACTN|nr:haloalkane dehalogenase [Kribbella pratensis]TDW77955.1 haloalkane dehalogenase [Kribbella pratensis]